MAQLSLCVSSRSARSRRASSAAAAAVTEAGTLQALAAGGGERDGRKQEYGRTLAPAQPRCCTCTLVAGS